MVVGDVGGDLGLGRPAGPVGLVDTAIEIDEAAAGIRRNLVVERRRQEQVR